jgi:hephaestin
VILLGTAHRHSRSSSSSNSSNLISQLQCAAAGGMSSGSGNSTDMAVLADSPAKGPLKGLEEPTSKPRKKWVLPAAAAGLLLLGLGIGLAIGLPLAFSNKRRAEAVELSAGGSGAAVKGTTRTYYLAADPIDWDYAPAGKNLCNGQPFDEEAQLYTSKGVGSKYRKAVYRQYKDDSFQVSDTRACQPAAAGAGSSCESPPRVCGSWQGRWCRRLSAVSLGTVLCTCRS